MYGETFDLLLGRRTYDLWSGFWPKAPKSPMADRLNAATKFVATDRQESLEWGPFEGIGPDLVNSVRGIKAKDGADLILSGSSTLTSSLRSRSVPVANGRVSRNAGRAADADYRSGTWELRVRGRDGVFRVFYYTASTPGILVFHAFQKKTQRTPAAEVERARKHLKELLDA